MNLVVETNSYINIEDANSYFEERLYSDTWTNANDNLKTQALLMAARNIDKLRFKGKKVNTTQKLAFPRYLYKPIGPDEYEIDHTGYARYEITERIKQAQCEEALALLKGIPKRMELQHQGVKTFKVGNLSEEYTGKKVKLLSADALELLKPYLIGSVRIT